VTLCHSVQTCTHTTQLIRRLEDEVTRRDAAVGQAQSRASAAEAAAKEVHRKLEEAENALAKQQRTGRAQVLLTTHCCILAQCCSSDNYSLLYTSTVKQCRLLRVTLMTAQLEAYASVAVYVCGSMPECSDGLYWQCYAIVITLQG
jgi:translation initiation factor 2B subunit (eIF-2B alpha/beta/delta family)